jgi:4-amino-4-deoxy-L-arabinose transferase-like glycosyltransferase
MTWEKAWHWFRRLDYRFYLYFLIPILLILAHFPFWNNDIWGYHDWRQSETQTVTENFYEEGMNIFYPRQNNRGSGDGLHRIEFPLYQWVNAVLFKMFGHQILVTRIYSFSIGLFTIWGFYWLIILLNKRKKIALIAAWLLAWSPAFYYYQINPMPYNMAFSFAVWSLVFFVRWQVLKGSLNLILSLGLLSLAILVKLPYIIFSTFLLTSSFLTLIKGEIDIKKSLGFLFGFGMSLLPAFLWYRLSFGNIDFSVVEGLFGNSLHQWPELIRTIWFNFRVTFPLILLNQGAIVAFWIGLVIILFEKKFRHKWFKSLLVLAITVSGYYIFEIKPIGTNHDYYLFPFLPLMMIIAALGIEKLLKLRWILTRLLALGMLISMPFYAYNQIKDRLDLDKCIYYSWFLKDIDSFKSEFLRSHSLLLVLIRRGISICII